MFEIIVDIFQVLMYFAFSGFAVLILITLWLFIDNLIDKYIRYKDNK